MFRTQIYLTEKMKERLKGLSGSTGKSQSKLIREAIDKLIREHEQQRKLDNLSSAAGIWSAREDIPDYRKLRDVSNRNIEESDQ